MKKKNTNIFIKLGGMRFLPLCMVLFLFCACGNEPKLVSKSEQNVDVVETSQTMETQENPKQEKCFVYVCGAVNIPGVYELDSKARIYEAVEAAGGFTDEASQVVVNLAEPISDGLQIYIPTIEEENTILLERKEEEAGRININTASSSELQSLPGIGASRAEAIVSYREQHGNFDTIEDIMNVTGIKAALFEQIREFITV